MKRKTTPSSASGPGKAGKKSSGKKKPGSRALEPEILPAEAEESEELEGETSEEVEPDESEIASSLPSSQLGRRGRAEPELIEADLESELPAVSSTDPLRRYMNEIRNHPLLDAQEELELVRRMHQEGDIHAAKRLVQANLRLVVKIAMEYRTVYSNLLDLIQEGNIGLMKAVSKFDPTKGARLGYYSSWWIRSYILKYLLDNFRLVKIGTTQAQKKLFYHLMREKERLEAQGLLTGPKLLAEKLNVREKDVIEMEQRLSGRGAEMSIDTPVGGDNDGEGRSTSHRDLIEDHGELADATLERAELLKILKSKLPDFQKRLGDKELRILNDRLLADEPKTLQEVADNYGLTRERARQIEVKVIEKLREFLREDLEGSQD